MRIRTKLNLTVCVLSLIIIGMFLATYMSIRKQKYDSLVINLAGRQRMLTQKMTKETLLFHSEVASGKEADPQLIQTIRSTASIFEKTLVALKDSGDAPLSLDPQSTDTGFCPPAQGEVYLQLEKVQQIWQTYAQHLDTILSTPGQADTSLAWILENNMPLLKTMNRAVGMMQGQSEAKMSRLLIMLFVGIVLGSISTGVAITTVRSISKRLDNVHAFTDKLSHGDLSVTISAPGQDELAQIGTSLNQMAQQLREMVQEMGLNAKDLNNSSQQLANVANDMVANAEDTSGRSNTVAAATEEMSTNMSTVASAIEQASQNINAVSNAAEQMTNAITEIAQNTERATNITQEAVGEAQNASQMVNKLGAAANEINKVTETITEISEQTNLLALNATIEAARAGEAGKGFAVVANEIKDLANQTAQATEDIRHKIEGIQGSTSQTVTEIEKITQIISEVNDIVATIASAVEEQSVTTRDIAGNVTNASQGIGDVSQSVSQTSDVASEVARDISTVNQAAGKVLGCSSDVKTNAQTLTQLSQKLREAVEQYTT